ncbi:MAG TPA: hypothetical protein VKU84_16585 [Stellaceae bacterium]|nr:hypothetical protein [Stellaceae bacterium]
MSGVDWQPAKISIGGSPMARAVNMAQEIAEKEYGLTDMNDNLREGDRVAKMPVETREMREAKENFWKAPAAAPGQMASPAAAGMSADAVIGMARQASAETRAQGADPMAMFHNTMKAHPEARARFRIIGK